MIKKIFFVIVFLLFPIFAISQKKTVTSQELTNTNVKIVKKLDNIVKENNTPKTILVKSEKGINTYEVYNETVRTILFNNKDKRDMLFSLPGFIELAVSSENSPIKVVIEENYATEYLNKYFKSH